MKNFKFRSWDKDHKYMEYTDKNLIVSFGDNGNVDATDLSNIYSTCNGMQNFELMQSTGLKDINGTEIYEGDILKVFLLNVVGDRVIDEYVYGEMAQEYGVIGLKNVLGGWGYEQDLTPLIEVGHVYEVIGNIYENPELLEDN